MNQEIQDISSAEGECKRIMVVITKKLEVNVIPEFSDLFSKILIRYRVNHWFL